MIYWCKKCKTPIFEKGLHSCSCDGKITKISESSICNPVFKQEKKLLEKIMDCSLGNEIIWYLGASKYLINEKIVKIPYREWYKQKKHLAIAEELRGDIEVERDYSPYMAVVSANEKYLNNIIYEAEQYIVQTLEKYKKDNYIPTVSFSGGKDSSVVSRLVMDALQDNTVIHMFGDTTLEFHETYIYVNEKFRRENPRVPMIPSETENDFFNSLTAVSAFKRLLPVLMISPSNTDNSLILLMLSFSFHILIFKVRCQSLCHHTYCDEDVT